MRVLMKNSSKYNKNIASLVDYTSLAPRDRWVVETNIFVTILGNNAKKRVSESPQTFCVIFLDNISIFKKFTKISRFPGFFQMGDN